MVMCIGVRRGAAFVGVRAEARRRRRMRQVGQGLYLGGRVRAHLCEQARGGNGHRWDRTGGRGTGQAAFGW